MFYICVLINKFANKIINILNLGAGYTWPGNLVLKIFPNILSSKNLVYKKGIIFVTGTNGKTTTVKLISHILEKSNFKVVTNKSGANLLNGIVTTILMDCDYKGKPQSDIAVFEVDEFTVSRVASYLKPSILVLLNLSRDQLDRYGEIDIVLDSWKNVVSVLPPSSTLIIDKNEKKFERFLDVFKGRLKYFDTLELNVSVPYLLGDFNKKNIDTALKVVSSLGIDDQAALRCLEDFVPAYGRGERLIFKSTTFHVFLGKNPKSLNNNLQMLSNKPLSYDALLFVLNDDPRDGRDVSWFYDIEKDRLTNASSNYEIFVSGTRCYDFASRLKYAGVPILDTNIFKDLSSCLSTLCDRYPNGNVLVFPNYSAMLEVREIITGKKIL